MLAIVLCLFVCLTTIILVIRQCVAHGSPSHDGIERDRHASGRDTEAGGEKPGIVPLALSHGQTILGLLLAGTAIAGHLLGDDVLSAVCTSMFCALFGPFVTLEDLTINLNWKVGKEDERHEKRHN